MPRPNNDQYRTANRHYDEEHGSMSDMGWPADDSVMADVEREAAADYRLAMTEQQSYVDRSDVYDDEPFDELAAHKPHCRLRDTEARIVYCSCDEELDAPTDDMTDLVESRSFWKAVVTAPSGHQVEIGPFGELMLNTFVLGVAENPRGRVILNMDDGGRMVIRHVNSPTGEEGDDPPEPDPNPASAYDPEPW